MADEPKFWVPLTESEWDDLMCAVGYFDQYTIVSPSDEAEAVRLGRAYDAAWGARRPVLPSEEGEGATCEGSDGPSDSS